MPYLAPALLLPLPRPLCSVSLPLKCSWHPFLEINHPADFSACRVCNTVLATPASCDTAAPVLWTQPLCNCRLGLRRVAPSLYVCIMYVWGYACACVYVCEYVYVCGYIHTCVYVQGRAKVGL